MVSTDLAQERQALVKADRDIADGTGRVQAQEHLLQTMRTGGSDTRLATQLLRSMRDSLGEWQVHRALIHARIDYLYARER